MVNINGQFYFLSLFVDRYFLEKNKGQIIVFVVCISHVVHLAVYIVKGNYLNECSFGEENGWQCKEKSSDYVWVLDPIDGTKSFITGTFLIILLRV